MTRLVSATFVARPNRFIVEARLRDGTVVIAHLADPGRLRELLLPGAELRLRPVPPEIERMTRYTVALVRAQDPRRPWVSVDTTLPNRLAARLLESGKVRGLGRCRELRREVTRGGSRFDFLVRPARGPEVWVEVKSVTLVVDGTARFPDAPTVRGARHVRELTEIVREGGQAMVLFLVQRHDAKAVSANPATDPGFAEALAEAKRVGVLMRAARFRLDGAGRATWLGPLPVKLGHSTLSFNS